jgi:hypothetical protein
LTGERAIATVDDRRMIYSAPPDPLALLDPRWVAARAELAQRFRAAEPFPHVVLDGFLRAEACRRLVDEFPSFERGNSLDENNRPGKKSVNEDLRALGPTFAALDDLIRSSQFLSLLGEITSVDRLLYDADYIGGGTHENLAGQDLDFHIDFNRHPCGWDRRLNLLLYLNPDWEESQGGCLELRRDPREPASRVLPLFNRAVLFETSERSWHGFEAIRRGTRRSIALYFYTEERRATAAHSTIYVEPAVDEKALESVPELLWRRVEHAERLRRRERSLLDVLRLELVQALSSGGTADPATLAWPLDFVDEEIARLYARETALRAALERAAALPRVPLRGRLRTAWQSGFWHDGWAGPRLVIRAEALADVETLIVRGQVPSELVRQELRVGGAVRELAPGPFEWELPLAAREGDAVELDFAALHTFCPRRSGVSDDSRELAWLVRGLAAR